MATDKKWPKVKSYHLSWAEVECYGNGYIHLGLFLRNAKRKVDHPSGIGFKPADARTLAKYLIEAADMADQIWGSANQ